MNKEAQTMDSAVRRFRQDVAVHLGHRTGTAVRYTPALRRRAVVIARKRQDAGVAIAAVARELGVRPRALRLWLQTPARPRLRRVAIAPAPVVAVDRPVLITPQGIRVEGLGAASLVALLRALA
jgi:transposase-like protein